ncbi:MAG: hypothetical protein EOP87_24380, partial [Verrucomicrobiaceae bacterium]
MSDASAETPGKKTGGPSRKPNRWGVGTLSLIQLILLFVVLGGLNYLSSLHYARKDLSRDGNYTLSSSTRRYLESDAIQKREKPVKWVMAFRRTGGRSPPPARAPAHRKGRTGGTPSPTSPASP